MGYEVAGSDIDKYIFIEDELRKRGIPIYSFDKNNIKDGYDVIIGNAFDESNEEVKEALGNPNVKTHTYYDFLAHLLDQYVSIGIAGTHGKTTTTGMAYHLFKEFDKTSVLIGDGTGHAVKTVIILLRKLVNIRIIFYIISQLMRLLIISKWIMLIISNLSEQYEKSFEQFANQVKDTVVVWGDDPHLPHLELSKTCFKIWNR